MVETAGGPVRKVCEAPAAVVLHAAHQELQPSWPSHAICERFASAGPAQLRRSRSATGCGSRRCARRSTRSSTRCRSGSPATSASSCSRAACRTAVTQTRRRRGHVHCRRSPADRRPTDSHDNSLWSGRFDAAPDAAAFEWGSSFSFDRRLFEDDVAGSLRVGAGAAARRRARRATKAPTIDGALADILERGRADPAFVDGAGRRRSQLRRAAARRTARRHRPPAAHRAIAQRAGVARSPARICAAAFPLLQGGARARASRRSRRRRRPPADALMPAFTHFRPAQPVLVAHFFLAHAAALRRDSRALRRRARTRPTALPLGSGAIAGTSYAVDVHALARDLGFSRVVANSIDASSDRDFAATFLYACATDDGAPEPAGRGSHHPLRRRAPVLRAVRRAEHRQQHDAAEEESGSARARARQDRPGDRPSDGAADHVEGSAERLQQGSAGGQARGLRCGRHAGRVPGGRRAGRERPDAESRSAPTRRHQACCSPPTLRIISWRAAFRSGARTRSSVRLVRRLVAEGREFGSLGLDEWRAASDLFEADIVTRVTPQQSVAAKRTPQSTAPAAVRAGIGGRFSAWLKAAPRQALLILRRLRNSFPLQRGSFGSL